MRSKKLITLADVQKARDLLDGVARRTPVETSRTLDSLSGVRVYLKCENFQRTGSFKFRGAYNALSSLSESERRAEWSPIPAATTPRPWPWRPGTAGMRVKIVMPEGSPAVKREAVKGYGGKRVPPCENTLQSREATANKLIAAEGLSLIHPSDNERVMAGAGTAALELVEEAGDLDLFLAPVGGGGLLSGTATAVKGLCPKAVVWGVEPRGADDAWRSLREGRILPQTDPRTIADGSGPV